MKNKTDNNIPEYIKRAIQINPTLSVLLTHGMEGWFYERYVNMLMYDSFIDYTDNINYSGLVGINRSYSYDEIIDKGLYNTIESILSYPTTKCYLTIWVDEYNIPASTRYKTRHFVHPLMIYDFDKDKRIFKCIIFNISKGNIFADITYDDLLQSFTLVNNFYMCGGKKDDALNTTIYDCGVINTNRGDFHLDVFAHQLNNYICSKGDNFTEWYTNSRILLYDNPRVIYGIQIYQNIIKWLDIKVKGKLVIQYKAIHDFIMHKYFLLDRFKYIQEKYHADEKFNMLINDFEKHCHALDKIRFINIKNQVSSGHLGASLCEDENFIKKLKEILQHEYYEELNILREIYDIIITLKYPENYLDRFDVASFSTSEMSVGKSCFNLSFNTPTFVHRIDIIRKNADKIIYSREKLVLNDSTEYYLPSDCKDMLPIRRINIPDTAIHSLKLYTDTDMADYEIKLFQTFHIDGCGKMEIKINDLNCKFSHMRNIRYNNGAVFDMCGNDPHIIWELDGLYADDFKCLQIDMESPSDECGGQVFFTTQDDPEYSDAKSFLFCIQKSPGIKTYLLDLSQNPLWKGKITKIRLDPINYSHKQKFDDRIDRTCHIQKIEFSKEYPSAMHCFNLYHGIFH